MLSIHKEQTYIVFFFFSLRVTFGLDYYNKTRNGRKQGFRKVVKTSTVPPCLCLWAAEPSHNTSSETAVHRKQYYYDDI